MDDLVQCIYDEIANSYPYPSLECIGTVLQLNSEVQNPHFPLTVLEHGYFT